MTRIVTPTVNLQRPEPVARSAYKIFRDIQTRWADNDQYGHVNNVVYYSWFDTAVNGLLIERGALSQPGFEMSGKNATQSLDQSPTVMGFVVETQCDYFAPLTFPEPVVLGIRVAHMGRSSVRYELGVFPADGERLCVAKGHFVHVYVDSATRRPVPLPAALVLVLRTLT